MENKVIRTLVVLGVLFTFIIPIIQLSIGFEYIVQDGQNATEQCAIALDLPLLMSIGGIFALFFLSFAYGFLKMLSSIRVEQSDMAGRMPRLLAGLVTFIFGSITLIFFILIQLRVYNAYSTYLQYHKQSFSDSCQPVVIHGALISIVLTYLSLLLFIGIYILVLRYAYYRRYRVDRKDIEMKITVENMRV